jgi:hypothetical protein
VAPGWGKFLSAILINNLFHFRRDHLPAARHREARTGGFAIWPEISGVAVAA